MSSSPNPPPTPHQRKHRATGRMSIAAIAREHGAKPNTVRTRLRRERAKRDKEHSVPKSPNGVIYPAPHRRAGSTGQAGRHTYVDRGRDLYETPPIAVESLLKIEELPHHIWEPAAGRGAIVRILRAHGHFVTTGDIHDYGFPLDHVGDFLEVTSAPAGCDTILTNPPFKIAGQFAEHALKLCPRVILLLRLAFLESVERTGILEGGQLAHVHVFRKRLPMMHRDGWAGPKARSQTSFAWICWSRDHSGPTTIDRV